LGAHHNGNGRNNSIAKLKPLTQPVAPTAKRSEELTVTGMTCSGCARHVTEALQSVSGVAGAQVLLEEKRAVVRWAPTAQPDAEALVQAVQRAGYEARIISDTAAGEPEPSASATAWSNSLLVALLATVALMAGEWIFGLDQQGWFRWTSLALATLVQFGPGRHFYLGAWRQLRVGSSNMDTLVALGSTTAYVYSVAVLLTGSGLHLYFMDAAAIISLVSLGHWVEARVSAQASQALRALLNLAPDMARRRNATGAEEEVRVSEVRPGEVLVLRPGDRVPVDGKVVEGESTLEESMLTGESLPVEKAPGASVFAGTVNLTGRLLLTATGTGDDTALAHIIATVQRAQTSRAAIQRLGDRVSSVFVPVVITVAVLAALWWGLAPDSARHVMAALEPFLWHAHPPASPLAGAVVAAAAVLIIACPCAMGLATPAAIMAGANAAARRGILIRDGIALEKAGRVQAVVFDKTGTLTHGRPEVVHTEAPAGASLMDPAEAAALAASLSAPSAHPLSQATARISPKRIPLTDWSERPGSGVEAAWQNAAGEFEPVRLGSLRWLESCDVDLGAAGSWVERWHAEGATVLGASRGTSLVLLIALRDTLKPEAAQVVRRLQTLGLTSYIITGDHPRAAALIAQQAGIAPERVFAEVRPEDKQALVRKLQQEVGSVAFVGDGINDAPALEQSDLGIAVMRASDVAREAADLVLLRSDIGAVPESLQLARATLRTIKQNLFWAFFYNALGIPLAALGFMSPILCAAAMGFSDLVVVGNALRLLRWRPRLRA
jgi:Cu+-exporting ATPase